MTDPLTNPHVLAVRSALASIDLAFDDDERRVAEVALYTAGVALSEKRDRLYCEETKSGWLKDATAFLDAHRDLPDWESRWDRWMDRVKEYCAMCDALDDGAKVIRLSAPALKVGSEMTQEMF